VQESSFILTIKLGIYCPKEKNSFEVIKTSYELEEAKGIHHENIKKHFCAVYGNKLKIKKKYFGEEIYFLAMAYKDILNFKLIIFRHLKIKNFIKQLKDILSLLSTNRKLNIQ
jgi:hypothetical protein